ncbi:MAG: hypothetical protein KKH28_06780, partial [Elusimicrobia bacterium]|nr:hypothetical protein [Elusimicrobiota bacterium]
MNKAALRQLQGDAVDIKEKAKNNRPDPALISGGMGVRISCWRLARIVSMMDGLGVVSGTGLELVYPRILQNGDPGGHTRRAFDELARRQPALAEPLRRLFDNYYIKGGKAAGKPYKPVPVWKLNRIEGYGRGPDSFWEPAREPQILSIAANFAEVWLAKEGHGGLVGINFLRKIERPMPCALYGAILAGVDYVVIGAGNPSHIPGMLRLLSRHEPASMPLKVYGTRSDSGEFSVLARPRAFVGDRAAALPPPKFLAIVSSFGLAQALAADPETRPYGFVVEGPSAGGHNAPPSKVRFDDRGQPILVYTEHDKADVGAIAGLGLPFWLAGSYASPGRLRQALACGAAGIQFGTLAALSGQSGMEPELRAQALRMIARGELKVTDTMVSPTGFPFKVAQLPGTLADGAVYQGRRRVCDISMLQANYLTAEGELGYRCPA